MNSSYKTDLVQLEVIVNRSEVAGQRLGGQQLVLGGRGADYPGLGVPGRHRVVTLSIDSNTSPPQSTFSVSSSPLTV